MTHGMSRRAVLGALGLGGLGVLAARPSAAGGSDSGVSFHGTWTYRSFLNNPDINTDFNTLEFARATITIEPGAADVLAGTIRWDGDQGLALKGQLFHGNPYAARFQGRGDTSTTRGWVYDYVGYLVPLWPDGVNQRPAIVGSVIRSVPHGNNPAGVVASFVAVKQDAK